MSRTITPAAIRKSFTVHATPEKAWAVFTAGFDSWWPRTHYLGPSPLAEVVLEPRVGGRWYGRHEDGVERPWGRVLAWEPPARLALDWQISHEWGFDPDLHTDVEVIFTPLGEGDTRVDFTHSGLERFGESPAAIETRTSMTRGWGVILDAYAAAAGG